MSKPSPFTRRRPSVPGRRRNRWRIYGAPWFPVVLVLAFASPIYFDWSTGSPPVAASAASGDSTIAGRASVIDGDTIEIRGTRIRFHGIDAPESAQLCRRAGGETWRCGQQAALALADRIGRATVRCRRTDTDRYKRMVAVCYHGEEDLNGWLVAQGWAVAYTRYADDYSPTEKQAKASSRGIWSSEFVMPWDWRRGNRIVHPAAPSRAAACDIKGNISGKGKRIYHVPGGYWYDRTKIDEAKGERWFCSEAAARAAGWRPSAR